MPRLSFSLENLKNIQDMIKFSDQKAGAVLVVYGFLISIYLEIGKGLSLSFKNISIIGIVVFVAGLISGVMILHEIISLLSEVIKPRLATSYNPEERCLYYFDHISRCSKSDLLESMLSIDETAMVSDIATQIHENAKILNTKLLAVKSAINSLIASGLSVAIYAILAKVLEALKC